jgi:hypothetical protein
MILIAVQVEKNAAWRNGAANSKTALSPKKETGPEGKKETTPLLKKEALPDCVCKNRAEDVTFSFPVLILPREENLLCRAFMPPPENVQTNNAKKPHECRILKFFTRL